VLDDLIVIVANIWSSYLVPLWRKRHLQSEMILANLQRKSTAATFHADPHDHFISSHRVVQVPATCLPSHAEHNPGCASHHCPSPVPRWRQVLEKKRGVSSRYARISSAAVSYPCLRGHLTEASQVFGASMADICLV
jgi:hypothetical protein